MKAFFVTFIVLFLCITQYVETQYWANFKRFQKENFAFQIFEKDENRIVFMGNSIAEGWSQHHPEFFKNKSYVNRGISSQTTPQMLIRFK